MGLQRPIGKSVKLAGANIGLEPTIPGFGVERGEPLPQLRHFLGRQLLDLALDLLDLAHLRNTAHRGHTTDSDRVERPATMLVPRPDAPGPHRC
jgi:hypothetical protein